MHTCLLLTLVNSPLQSVVTCFSVSTLEDPDRRRWLQTSFVRVFLWIPLILSIRLWSAFQHLSCFSVVWHMSGLGWFGHHVPQQLILSRKQLSGPITVLWLLENYFCGSCSLESSFFFSYDLIAFLFTFWTLLDTSTCSVTEIQDCISII